MANKVEIQIVGNNVYAVNAIDGVKTKLGTLEKQSRTTADRMMCHFKMIGGAFLAGGAISFMKSSIEAFKEQEMAAKKLDVALGRNSFSLQQYASHLQKTTTFSDELSIESMSLIAAFTKEESQIKKLIQASMDLSAAKGIELHMATDFITKAVYTEYTGQLHRQGIEAKGVVGSIARLNMVVEQISELYGGQATEQAKTYSGQLEILNNALSDQQEDIGGALLPIWVAFNQVIADNIKNLQILSGLDYGKMLAMQEAAALSELGKLTNERFDVLLETFNVYEAMSGQTVILTDHQKKALKEAAKNREEEEKKLEALRKQNQERREEIAFMEFRAVMDAELDEEGMYEPPSFEPIESDRLNTYMRYQMNLIDDLKEYELAAFESRENAALQSFSNMANAMYSFYDATGQRSKAAFALFKAFSIAQTIAATYVAATAALEPPPIGAGPLFGPILAATTIAAGLANVASILSTNIGSHGGGGGRSASPSMPGNITNSNNRNANYSIVINTQGGFSGDPDKFAREIIWHLDKARSDGG